ncbi:hypothetical protein [Thioalkalivibrio sp. ALE16]|uniref:hypothetical protein n=1 Tax=Thioalkalivibrio sp. ALE16 TaxID=1158172 RepID=UPI001E35F585|nr:hypothetical protein [Thioalkalivibrio sp. ALE16]
MKIADIDRDHLAVFAEIPVEAWLIQAQLLGIMPDIDGIHEREQAVVADRFESRLKVALKNHGLH